MNNWITLRTRAFNQIYGLLERAQMTSAMYAGIGSTGCGKTLTIQSYKLTHENVFVFKIEKTLKPRDLYRMMLESLGVFDYDNVVGLNSLAMRFAHLMKQRKNALLIFDEAGKFSADMMEYFQAIRDATETNVGIVLLGTGQFKANMDDWRKKQLQGIPELCSRIYSWTEIFSPSDNEKFQILEANGITDPTDLRELVKKSSDLRKLYQNVLEYRFNKAQKSSAVAHSIIFSLRRSSL